MAKTAQLAKKIAAYDKNRKSSAAILNEAMAKYGVPEIRQNVANLRTTLENTQSALNNVDPSVTGRTSRSLVTEAQRQAIVNDERAPIAQNLSSQQGILSTESANLADQMAAANTFAQGRISDYATGRDALVSQYDLAAEREARALAKAQADREYRLSVQKARQSASSSKTARVSQGEAESIIRQAFKPGKDGYVSPSQWNRLLKDWNAEGLSTSSFAKAFKQYANPFHYKSKKNANKYGAYQGVAIKD